MRDQPSSKTALFFFSGTFPSHFHIYISTPQQGATPFFRLPLLHFESALKLINQRYFYTCLRKQKVRIFFNHSRQVTVLVHVGFSLPIIVVSCTLICICSDSKHKIIQEMVVCLCKYSQTSVLFFLPALA